MKLPNLLKCGYQNNMKNSETDDTFYLDLHFFLNKAVDTYGNETKNHCHMLMVRTFLRTFSKAFIAKVRHST